MNGSTSNWKKIKKSWNPVEVHFGSGSSQSLGQVVKGLNHRSVFFVTDRFILEQTAMARNLEGALEENTIEHLVWAEVQPEPKLEVAESITTAIRKGKYDCIVGLGGGSVLDMAKVAAGMYTNAGYVKDYLGVGKIKKETLDSILIPTTAGTGSDVTNRAMVTADEKAVIASDALYARISLADPSLTISMPPKVTADTGFDSLSHAIEGIMSNEKFDGVDEVEQAGYEAVRLILENIRQAVMHGDDLRARENMMHAAMLSGFVLSKKAMVYGHSMGYPFAPRYRVPHGRSAVIALPYVMQFSTKERGCARKIAKLADFAGIGSSEQADEAKVDEFVQTIKRLRNEIYAQLNVPITLQGIGVPREDLGWMAKLCLEKWPRPTSPVPATVDDISSIYLKMWSEN